MDYYALQHPDSNWKRHTLISVIEGYGSILPSPYDHVRAWTKSGAPKNHHSVNKTLLDTTRF